MITNDRIVRVGQIWQHYKGGLYTIVTLAKYEPDPLKIFVIYKSHSDGSVWARDLDIFLESLKVVGYNIDNGKPIHKYRFTCITR